MIATVSNLRKIRARIDSQTLHDGQSTILPADIHLALAHNTCLRSIRFDLHHEDDWIVTTLPQVTSTQLSLVTIWIPDEVMEDSDLDRLHCDRIDEILSRPHFSGVQKLVFEYHGSHWDSNELNWLRSAISRRLPLSFARGILYFERRSTFFNLIH